jgi:hypothetical protein
MMTMLLWSRYLVLALLAGLVASLYWLQISQRGGR